MELEFSGVIFHWRGPSPYHYVAVPEAECAVIKDASKIITYGWGMIPVTVQIGDTTWTTSLFPKNGGYLLPIKDHVRRAEILAIDDMITARLTLAI